MERWVGFGEFHFDSPQLAAGSFIQKIYRNASPENGFYTMKAFIKGIRYNFKGLVLGLKTPALLFLGLVRLVGVILLTVAAAAALLAYHQDILNQIWIRPDSAWIVWLWHLLSWGLTLVLVGAAAVVSYLVCQILFSVFIMDRMSQITERKISGLTKTGEQMPVLRQFVFLVKQEVPRAIVPLVLILLLTLLGWLTPLGPVLTIVTSIVACVFLAWDNTDLVPARRLEPFGKRFKFLFANFFFHFGFGVLFLIPLLNILLLSFAPVGATLYHIDEQDLSVETGA
jgi:CysZ protein